MARRFEEMKFANSGPFGRHLDGRIGRSFSDKLPKHTATAEDYSIGAALAQKTLEYLPGFFETQAVCLVAAFGREQDSSGRRPRRRGGRGRKKVTA